MRRCVLRTVRFAILLGVTMPATLTAQSRENGERRERVVIGDHMFISSPLTRDPLPRTYVAQDLGIGSALDLEFLPSFEVGGDTISAISGDLLFALLGIEYQHAVKEWLAVWGRADMVARLGTNVGALLSEGATVLTGFELGWMIRLAETEKIGLSATANLWNNNFLGINLLDWVDGIVTEQPVDLVRSVPSVRAGGGLRLGWAVSDLVGVSGLTEIAFGESVGRRGEDHVSYKLAGSVDFDLSARTTLPLGIGLSAELDTAPREATELTDRLGRAHLRLAYTGRDNFLVGLDVGWASVSLADASKGQDLGAGSLSLHTRYYF